MTGDFAVTFHQRSLVNGLVIGATFTLIGLLMVVTGWTGTIFRSAAVNRVVGAGVGALAVYLFVLNSAYFVRAQMNQPALVVSEESLTSRVSGFRTRSFPVYRLRDISLGRHILVAVRDDGKKLRVPMTLLETDRPQDEFIAELRQAVVDSDES